MDMTMTVTLPSQTSLSKPKFPWLYIILSYGWTWLFWIPIALTRQDYQESPLLLGVMFLGLCGPAIAGITLTYYEQGRIGTRDFRERVFDYRRIRPVWYALIFLLFPVLHLISITINNWLGGTPPKFEFIKEAVSVPIGAVGVIILYLLQAGLEELGWRGYMLDRLQARWRPLSASLILGVFHAFWHLPTFFIMGTNQSRWGLGIETWLFFAFVLASSIYSTWCYNGNQRSILAVILLHTTANLFLDTFLLPGIGEWIFKILFTLSACAIIIVWITPRQKKVTEVRNARIW